MQYEVKSAEVAGKIGAWYNAIIEWDVNLAKQMKQEAERMLPKMKPDNKIVTYYQLVDFRYKLMTSEFQFHKTTQQDFDILQEPTLASDNILQYLYYFMSGQYEFYRERYRSAIHDYKIAESLLENIDDSAEKAEFYYRLGSAFYRIKQHTFAVYYTELSIELMEEISYYEEKILHGRLHLGLIATELGKLPKADEIFEQIILSADPHPVTKAIALRGLGLNRLQQNRHEEAKTLFLRSLNIHHSNGSVRTKTKYNLAALYFHLQQEKDGLALLTEVEKDASRLEMDEYLVRCTLLRGLYIDDNLSIIDQGLSQLREKELFVQCSEIAEEVSTYLEIKGDESGALRYLKQAHAMRRDQKIIGIDQL